jgi:hypothetical protein
MDDAHAASIQQMVFRMSASVVLPQRRCLQRFFEEFDTADDWK